MPRRILDTGSSAGAYISGLFAQETTKENQSRLFHLIVLDNIKGYVNGVLQTEEPLYLVDSNYAITYTSVEESTPVTRVYEPFPLQFSGASISSDGTIDKATITVSNVSRALMDLVEMYDGLAGCTVSVLTVYEKFLDYKYVINLDGEVVSTFNTDADPDACLRDEYVIDAYSANEQSINFQLNAVVDFEIRVPRRLFAPHSCYWRFKGDECGYPGTAAAGSNLTLTTCKKTLEDCKNHGNSKRYGGFPGVPSDIRRLYL